MAEFKRKKGENFESFLRRFNRGLKSSRRLNIAREKISLSDKPTKRQRKLRALKGLEIRKEKEFLKKIGKLPEENIRKR